MFSCVCLILHHTGDIRQQESPPFVQYKPFFLMTDKGQKGNQHDISQIQLSFIFMLSSALDFFSPTFMNCGGKLNVRHLEKGRKAKER